MQKNPQEEQLSPKMLGKTTDQTIESAFETSTLQSSTENTTSKISETNETKKTDSTALSISMIDTSTIEAGAEQVAYGIYYFNSKEYISNQQTAPMISASVIKVFIMEYVFVKQLNLETLLNGETLDSLVRRMIQVSDNDATNKLIDFIGMPALNTYFAEAGYHDTKLQRKMLDTQAQSRGIENYTSLADTLSFLKKVYEKQEQVPYSDILTILLGQQVSTKLRRNMPTTIPVANKTGELAGVENDIGIVFAKNPFAIVVLTNGVYDSGVMQSAIGELAVAATQIK